MKAIEEPNNSETLVRRPGGAPREMRIDPEAPENVLSRPRQTAPLPPPDPFATSVNSNPDPPPASSPQHDPFATTTTDPFATARGKKAEQAPETEWMIDHPADVEEKTTWLLAPSNPAEAEKYEYLSEIASGGMGRVVL